MKIILSSQGSELTSPVDRRFGRAPWLVLFDVDTEEWQAFANPGSSQSGGAGIAASQFAVDKQASVAISGDFGPNAANVLRAANIEMQVFMESVETVQQALDLFFKNQLQKN